MKSLKENPQNFNQLKTRLVAAITKTDAASYGGLFKDELKELIRDVVNVLKKMSPEDQVKMVELEEKWADLMNERPGRPADPNHPVHIAIGKLYKKYDV